MDAMVTGMYAEITHLATCPEISPVHCAEETLPDHTHDQSMGWMRGGPQFNFGVGKGFQLNLSVPVDFKVLGISYSLLDGTDYEPPYSGLHHRNEVLFGQSDGQLGLRWFGWAFPTLLVGGGVATTLPWAVIERDPFELATQSLQHQHFQRGTGTFIPSVHGSLIWSKGNFGLMVNGGARFSLYENRNGYQPGSGLQWGVGPTYSLNIPLTFHVSLEGAHDGADRWAGETAPSSGRHALIPGLNVLYMASSTMVLQAQIKTTAWQRNLSSNDNDQLMQKVMGTIGVSWTRRPKDEHAH
jgi:hypothetical protein